jgi:hypothetical protein
MRTSGFARFSVHSAKSHNATAPKLAFSSALRIRASQCGCTAREKNRAPVRASGATTPKRFFQSSKIIVCGFEFSDIVAAPGFPRRLSETNQDQYESVAEQIISSGGRLEIKLNPCALAHAKFPLAYGPSFSVSRLPYSRLCGEREDCLPGISFSRDRNRGCDPP